MTAVSAPASFLDGVPTLTDEGLEREFLSALLRALCADDNTSETLRVYDLDPGEVGTEDGRRVLAGMQMAASETPPPLTPGLIRSKIDVRQDSTRRLFESLVDAPGTVARLPDYVDRLRELSHARLAWQQTQRAQGFLAEGDYERGRAELQKAVEDPVGDEGLEYVDLDRIAEEGIPPVPWLLPGWLAEQEIVLFAGAGGIGKSTTAAALAQALARGEEWCGIDPVRPTRVLVVDEEQDENTAARLYLRLKGPHDGLRLAVGQGLRLDEPAGVARLEQAITAHEAEVVVLDSAQQTFGNVDENSAQEVGSVFKELFRLRERHNVAFVLVHHVRKSQQGWHGDALELVRGSSAFGTQASAVWISYSPGPGRLNLVQKKNRKGTKKTLAILYEEDGADGNIKLSGEGPVGDASTEQERAEEWVVDFLTEYGATQRKNILEAVEREEDDSLKVRTVDRALGHLKKIGTLSQPKRGSYDIAGREGGLLKGE